MIEFYTLMILVGVGLIAHSCMQPNPGLFQTYTPVAKIFMVVALLLIWISGMLVMRRKK